MPLYEYECQACGKHLEEQQKMADAALVTCPACGKDQLQRLISATSFHLKGGGWYKDLYASAKPGAEGTSGGGSAAPAASSDTAAAPAAASSDKTSSDKPSTPAAAPAAPPAAKTST